MICPSPTFWLPFGRLNLMSGPRPDSAALLLLCSGLPTGRTRPDCASTGGASHEAQTRVRPFSRSHELSKHMRL
jgi:hypothetical protein